MFTQEEAIVVDEQYYNWLHRILNEKPGNPSWINHLKYTKRLRPLEQAMVDGIITVDECFMLEKLANA